MIDATTPTTKRKRTAAEVAADERRSSTNRATKQRDRERNSVTLYASRELPKHFRRGPQKPWAAPLWRDWKARERAMVEDAGGRDRLPEWKLAGLVVAGEVFVTLNATYMAFEQTGDLEAASRVSSLASTFMRTLSTLQLDRVPRDVPQTLDDFLAARAAAQAARGGELEPVADAELVDQVDRAPDAIVERSP